MKILQVISSLAAGGAEVYVRDLSSRMVAEGHDVCIVFVSSAIATNRCSEYEASFKRQLSEAGVSFFEIGYVCRRMPWKGGALLRKIVKKFKPDVVHSHLYYGLFFKALSFTSVPLVYTHHNHRLGKGRLLYPFFNWLVDRYVGISRDCTDVLKAAGVSDVTTIYNGVSNERLLVKQQYDCEKTRVSAFAMGKLDEQKNFSLLIKACNVLLCRRTDLHECFTLKIAGEGPQKGELQKLIVHLGLTFKIELLGNRQDISQLLHDSDLFVMSSDWEGLPIALLEALMTGVPVVVTDVGGCRDVVEACDAGLVVPPQDVRKLADALEYMVDNQTERIAMSEHARLNAQQYSIENSCRQHLSLYQTFPGCR